MSGSSRISRHAEMLRNRVHKRFRHLRKWARRERVTCFRVYDRDIPEIPLAIDWYDGALHIAYFGRDAVSWPGDGDSNDPAAADDDDGDVNDADDAPPEPASGPFSDDAEWLRAMAAAAADALSVPAERVWLKRHERQRGASQYTRQDAPTLAAERARARERAAHEPENQPWRQPAGEPDRGAARAVREVTEHGLRFEVDLGAYLDTGLFLDHRAARALVRRDAAGARFLNLFCYTGAFTVHAAAGGARETVSVDLSRRYLDWARRNMASNGFSGPAHHFLRADVCALVADAARDRNLRAPHANPDAIDAIDASALAEPFDLAVLDPPTFSNSKAMRGSFDVARDHVALIRDTLRLLRPGGVLYFSTNRRRFALDAAAIPASAIEDITAATAPPDFRLRPHRAWRIRR